VEERKEHGDQGREDAGEGGGESHGTHGEGSIKDGQSQGAFKPAEGGIDEVVGAGPGQAHSLTEGEEQEKREDVAGSNDQHGWSTAGADAANEIGPAPGGGRNKSESGRGC
jgi:hypothetical protein